MLEIQRIRKEPEAVIKRLLGKYVSDAAEKVQNLLGKDESRRNLLTLLESDRKEMNLSSKSIGVLMGQGKTAEANVAKEKTASLKERIKSQEKEVSDVEKELEILIIELPNTPHESVPEGRTEESNKVIYQNDVKIMFDFTPKPHWELAIDHDIISWELGSKITGAGFPVYMGKGAALQRALISWFLENATADGYTEVMPPLLVNADSGFGTGQLPDKEGQMYHTELDGLYLIPTAEVPITNLFRDVIVKEEDFPIKRCGYTPCFRREAGSYGKDVKGLNRLHQFDKVEVVQIVHPDHSYKVLEAMNTYVQGLLTKLGLPFRQLLLCTGDVSFASAKTYDMEVFSAGQEMWLEVSSVSNFESFQANRLKLRFKGEDKKMHFAHTLNGSALALPRILAALLENNQQADGSIVIPEVLRKYTGFDTIG